MDDRHTRDVPGGARNMAQKPIVATEADFNQLFEAVVALISLVTGRETGKPRFAGFKILDSVREYMNKALALFEEGNYTEGVRELTEARKAIVSLERAYARNSVDKFFMPMMAGLGKLDDDLNKAIGKRFREYQEIISLMKTSNQVDMNEVSRRYWALLDRIQSAPNEQAARIRNRAERQRQEAKKEAAKNVAECRRTEEMRAEEARQRQIEAEENRRVERQGKARNMLAQFEAVVA